MERCYCFESQTCIDLDYEQPNLCSSKYSNDLRQIAILLVGLKLHLLFFFLELLKLSLLPWLDPLGVNN